MNSSDPDADQDAFHEEAVPHIDALYGTALKMTKDEQEAEDLVQETMLKAYRYFDKYENGTNCKAWLFKIMHNTFINRYRKSQKRKEYLVDDNNHRSLQERAEAPEEHPFVGEFEDEEDVYFKMFGDEVKEALTDLPDHFRMVVLLADLQDFAYKEIAEIMDCPIGTVMSRLYRGRRMLRDELDEYAEQKGVVELEEDGEETAAADGDETSAEAEGKSEAEAKTTDLNEYREKKKASG